MPVRKPYSDWIERTGWIHLSGKIGVDRSVPAGFAAQAANVMTNVSAALRDAGCGWPIAAAGIRSDRQ